MSGAQQWLDGYDRDRSTPTGGGEGEDQALDNIARWLGAVAIADGVPEGMKQTAVEFAKYLSDRHTPPHPEDRSKPPFAGKYLPHIGRCAENLVGRVRAGEAP
jgi:hypothetical protein